MMTTELLPQLESIDDYNDGKKTMVRLATNMSATSICSYADSCGSELDELSLTHDYFRGLRDGLAVTLKRAIKRVPSAKCSWEPIEGGEE